MPKEEFHRIRLRLTIISQLAELEILQTFSKGLFSFLDLNNKIGIGNPSFAYMALVQILSKTTPLPWELRKWSDPNSTWSALFSFHAPTPTHYIWAKQNLEANLIQFAFIYNWESGFSEMFTFKDTYIHN